MLLLAVAHYVPIDHTTVSWLTWHLIYLEWTCTPQRSPPYSHKREWVMTWYMELSSLFVFPHRNLPWWRRTAMAPTTLSSQEAQSTSRIWSERRAAGRWWTLTYTVYTNKTHHLPRTLRAFLDMLGKGGGHELTDNCTLRKKKWLFVDKYFWSSFLYQNQTWEQSRVKDLVRHFVSLCPVGFDSYGVYSMVPHHHSRTHTVCCLCSSCLTDTSCCAFLHRRVICFICCYYDLISVFLSFCFARFIFVLQQ